MGKGYSTRSLCLFIDFRPAVIRRLQLQSQHLYTLYIMFKLFVFLLQISSTSIHVRICLALRIQHNCICALEVLYSTTYNMQIRPYKLKSAKFDVNAWVHIRIYNSNAHSLILYRYIIIGDMHALFNCLIKIRLVYVQSIVPACLHIIVVAHAQGL